MTTDYFFDRSAGDKAFWLCNGKKIDTIRQLYEELDNISDQVYSYHVNKDKNDFALWIKAVFNDKVLYEYVSNAANRKQMKKLMGERISEIIHEKYKSHHAQENLKSHNEHHSNHPTVIHNMGEHIHPSTASTAELNQSHTTSVASEHLNETQKQHKSSIFLNSMIDFILGFIVGALVMVVVMRFT